jgi:hypothetical protein
VRIGFWRGNLRPERMRPLGRRRRRRDGSINMDLQEVGLGGGGDWINLAQNRDRWLELVKAIMNLRVP